MKHKDLYYHIEYELDRIAKKGGIHNLALFFLHAQHKGVYESMHPRASPSTLATYSAALSSGRYAAFHVPPTRLRVGCLTCGSIAYLPVPMEHRHLPMDLVQRHCTHCSRWNVEAAIEVNLLYRHFGGLLDEN